VRDDQVATVDQRFDSDRAGTGSLLNGATDPQFGNFGTALISPLTGRQSPGRIMQFLGTADGGQWLQSANTPQATFTGAFATYTAGRRYQVSWGHGPLAPGFGDTFHSYANCGACLAGSTVDLNFNEVNDSVAGHSGSVTGPVDEHLVLYWNGTQLADAPKVGTSTTLPGTTGILRAVLDTDRSADSSAVHATTTHTDVTMRVNDSGPTLPANGDYCDGFSPTTPCRVLPAPALHYDLATDQTGTSFSPVQTMELTGGHLSYDGTGAQACITSASVSVSFDNGTTWQPVTITGTAGEYLALWQNPLVGQGKQAVAAGDRRRRGRQLDQPDHQQRLHLRRERVMKIALTAAALLVATLTPIAPIVATVDVCGPAPAGHARCLAEIRTPADTSTPSGYSPADLRNAYNLPIAGGADQTVGIVDAGDDPNAESDLAVYRAVYGLPPCTTANGCFRKVNQRGAAGPLPHDRGWGPEISLDVDMVSAACPSCRILLVEADESALTDLAPSVDTAVALGANEVSNSYGEAETGDGTSYEPHYVHPGVAMVASSGDAGYHIPVMPAVFPTVIAAGGTSLTRVNNARGWTEQAWSGAGSGCSAWVDKPAWQHDPNCPGRMTADVAADADPKTGPSVYDSYRNSGWVLGGGTSAAAPFIAGVIALAGNPGRFADASPLYAQADALNDVVGGSNAGTTDCGGDYQCNAVTGYDGPTGNGTPNGLAAF
jgi:hypothetical protein